MSSPDYRFQWSPTASVVAGGDDSPSSEKLKDNPLLSVPFNKDSVYTSGNHVYFYAGVSKESVYLMKQGLDQICESFAALQRKNPDVEMTPSPIYLHINSYGGGVFAAFAAIDFIQQCPIPVYTIVEGATASAGTIMSVVGKKRFIRPHASMLIHQLSSWFGGKLTQIDDEYQNLKQMHQQIIDIYEKHAKIQGEELESLLKHDLWLTAEKCVEHGLVDEPWAEAALAPSKL